MLLVDLFFTESTLEAAFESKKGSHHTTPSTREDMINDFTSQRMDVDSGSLPRKLVECKICHDEDEEINMEIPCSCRGSLKVSSSLTSDHSSKILN